MNLQPKELENKDLENKIEFEIELDENGLFYCKKIAPIQP